MKHAHLRLFLLIVFVTLVHSKVFEMDFSPTLFRRQSNWVFLTKMGFDRGSSRIEFNTKIRGVPHNSELAPLELAIIPDTEWQDQLRQRCNSKRTDLKNDLQANGYPSITYKTIELTEQHLYYFVLKDCESKLIKEYSNNGLFVEIKLTMINNDSHLSSDEDSWLIFPLMIGISLWLTFRNHRGNIWGEEFDWAKFLLFSGIVTNLAALFWKGLNFIIYWKYGTQYMIFDIFYLGMHALSETIVICLILLIAYGWTINYINGEDFDLYIPLMTMMGLLNIIITILNKINDTDHDKYHMYDSVPGYILVGFRILLLIIYLAGVFITYRKTLPKKRPFFLQFSVCGLIYILSMPILLFLVEAFVQQRRQNEILFLGVELFKTVSNILLTYMITSKKSEYAKICYRNLSFLANSEKFF